MLLWSGYGDAGPTPEPECESPASRVSTLPASSAYSRIPGLPYIGVCKSACSEVLADVLLLEDGDDLLLEDSDLFDLETSSCGDVIAIELIELEDSDGLLAEDGSTVEFEGALTFSGGGGTGFIQRRR